MNDEQVDMGRIKMKLLLLASCSLDAEEIHNTVFMTIQRTGGGAAIRFQIVSCVLPNGVSKQLYEEVKIRPFLQTSSADSK